MGGWDQARKPGLVCDEAARDWAVIVAGEGDAGHQDSAPIAMSPTKPDTPIEANQGAPIATRNAAEMDVRIIAWITAPPLPRA